MTTNSDASQAAVLPPLPLRDRDERRISIWRLVDAWSDAEAGLDAAKIADQFEDAVDALLAEYGTAAIAQDRAARAQAEPVAWQWRKRHTWFAGKPDETSFWSEWEALQPPYMDARDFAKSDPANYEIRPLYAAARAQGAGEAVGVVMNRVKDGITHKVASLYLSGKDLPLGTQLYAASAVPQAAEVPGFVLVPREPTMEMLRAAVECPGREGMRSVYSAMISAAPTPTASAPKAEGEGEAEAAQSWNVLKLLGRYDQAQSNLAQALLDGVNVHGEIARVKALREELEAALARPMFATQPPSSANRTREGGDVVAPFDRLAINPTHEAADAFWAYWRENGETHKHGYYESTWGAINRALRVAGIRLHDYGTTPSEGAKP